MHFFEKTNSKFQIQTSKIPSNCENLKKLKNFSPIRVPDDYVEILSLFGELIFIFSENTSIKIYNDLECIEKNSFFKIQNFIPKSLAIGEINSKQILIYMKGKLGFGIYLIDFDNYNIENIQKISTDIKSLIDIFSK